MQQQAICASFAGLASAVRNSPLNGVAKAFGVSLDAPQSGLTLEGPLAGALRRAAYWYRQPTNTQKLRVAREWFDAALASGRPTAGRADNARGGGA